MQNNNFCVIMAGGVGSRFWPLSRQAQPKQFLDILGTGRSLIQLTFDRFSKLFPPENIIVVTSKEYQELVKQHLPEIPLENILSEPLRRNTAPCIAYAYQKIKLKSDTANIVVAPSDHLILLPDEFLNVIEHGLNFVQNNNALLTLGIKPSRPETGYGYIQIENDSNLTDFQINKHILKVKTFTEKPQLEMAQTFFESGEFFWNSGIFLWSVKTIETAFEQFLPEIYQLFAAGTKQLNTPNENMFIEETYQQCPNISIDYGIMEHANNVHVLLSDFGWSDLGTWGSLFENSEKQENNNVLNPDNVFAYDTQNSIVKLPKDKIAVIQGLENYIVVDNDEVLLICKRENEQHIKQYVNDLKRKKGEQYL